MPSFLTCATSSSMRLAPSSRENSLWVWRWTNDIWPWSSGRRTRGVGVECCVSCGGRGGEGSGPHNTHYPTPDTCRPEKLTRHDQNCQKSLRRLHLQARHHVHSDPAIARLPRRSADPLERLERLAARRPGASHPPGPRT